MDPFTFRDTCSTIGAAAREGDCELLYRLIQEGKPIDVRDNRGWSPLHEAAAHNSFKCMKVLLAFLEDSEDIDLVSFEGETPLFLTAMSNCDESMKILLENGTNVNLANQMGQTPLMKLISKKVVNPLCLELLLEYQALVSARMWNGWTALHEAAFWGNCSVVKRLLEAGASIDLRDDHEIQPVFTAAQYGRLECLTVLLDAGANPNSRATDGASALYIAAQENYPECMNLLLSRGARTDLKVGGYATPLHVAAWKGNIKCMEILDPITKPCLIQYTPLHHAAQNGQLKAVKYLIANGHDKETGVKLCSEGNEQEGIPVEGIPSLEAEPPLICALEERELVVVEYLLSLNSPQIMDCNISQCPLFISFPHTPSLKLLLEYGADVNCGHVSICSKFVNFWDEYKCGIKFLLDHGMEVDLSCKVWVAEDICDASIALGDCGDFFKFVKLFRNYMTNLNLCRHVIATLQNLGQLETLHTITDHPPTLQNICRIYIRKQVGCKRLVSGDWIDHLPIPPPLKDLLLYKDILFDDDDNPATPEGRTLI